MWVRGFLVVLIFALQDLFSLFAEFTVAVSVFSLFQSHSFTTPKEERFNSTSSIMHLPNVSLLPLSLVLFSATQTLAQTSTDCDPTKKSCPADTALSESVYTHDFTTGADDENWKVTAGDVKYTSKGAEFTINKAGDAPTIQSNWYIFFGSVSFVMKAAPGKGVVSSAILESDDLDEVDWEWLGGQPGNVQSKSIPHPYILTRKKRQLTHPQQTTSAKATPQPTTAKSTPQSQTHNPPPTTTPSPGPPPPQPGSSTAPQNAHSRTPTPTAAQTTPKPP